MRARTGKPTGRPKSNATLMAMKMREELVKRVKKEFKPILLAQIDSAKGLAVHKAVTTSSGRVVDHYYDRVPHLDSSKYLLDQALGRPKESLELSGEVKTIAEVVSELDEET